MEINPSRSVHVSNTGRSHQPPNRQTYAHPPPTDLASKQMQRLANAQQEQQERREAMRQSLRAHYEVEKERQTEINPLIVLAALGSTLGRSGSRPPQ